jgi:excisionase family DNA binding protein
MPAMLTVAQVAEILRLKPQTIRNWIDARTFPAMHIGRESGSSDALVEAGSTAGTGPIWDAPVERAAESESRR